MTRRWGTRRFTECLANGRHTPGSEWERECPVLRRQNRLAKTRNVVANTYIPAPPESPEKSGGLSRGSEAGFGVSSTTPTLAQARTRLAGGHPRGGRPRVSPEQASPRTRSRRRRGVLRDERSNRGRP
jgi:hypothetical protein